MTNNPLLEPSALPNQAPDFDQIVTTHYLPAIEAAIEEARGNVTAIKSNSAAPNFENTIVALESASETLDHVSSVFFNGLSAMGGDALHEIATKIAPLSANFSSDVMLDEALFARVKAVYENRKNLQLTAEETTLLDDTYREFIRAGASLEGDKKQRLREIAQESSTLGPAFMQNATKSAEAFELPILDDADLAGLPQSAIDGAKSAAENKGYEGWLFTLDAPSFMPFLQYGDNRALREKIWRAFASRAWNDAFDNSGNIQQIVALRHERAQLLGYDSHADYVLERRMAERPETVMAFLEKLKNAYRQAAENELAQLKSFARETDGLEDLQPWDVSYYGEKLKEQLFEFSSEDLRPYFPLDNVLSGCFEHFSKLFGLRFDDASGKYPVWHEDVKAFDVFDDRNGAFLGTLYGDFHPRTGKNDGAWKTSYRNQGLFHGRVERPVIAIVCNFTKPTKDKPSLLSHREVTTLFHEMGHAIHGMLSNVTYRSHAGTSVLWDFVELPSQIQENWCLERETLDLFACHYETGEKIPEDLVEKLRKAKNFMVGFAGLRQVSFGLLDMAWHHGAPANIEDVAAFEDEVTKETSLFPRLAGPSSTAFSHIFAGGYSAGYYSYKWAEVLDADAFELFLERGLYDQDTAQKFRERVLSRGGAEHPKELYRNFRGRDAEPEALFRREGLLAASA